MANTLKTRPTDADVLAFIHGIANPQRKQDALALLPIMEELSAKPAVMWGDSLIGFGRYYYNNTAGKQFEWPVTGFSPRKRELTVYIMPGFDKLGEELAQLIKPEISAKVRTGKSCLYIPRLDNIDLAVLSKIICIGIDQMHQRYQCD